MKRLVVVSNRVAPIEEGTPPTGGLAVGLSEALQRTGGLWFGWTGDVVDGPGGKVKVESSGAVAFATVDLSRDDYEAYYNGCSNQALWPLLHYRVDLMTFKREHYRGYLHVNEKFAKVLKPLLDPGDVIWIHDYHLIPLADALRRLGVRQPIGFFLHTPFPPRQIVSAFPGHKDLFQRLFAYDLVGFQTAADLECFRDYVERELDGEVRSPDSLRLSGRDLRVGAFPIGIDTENIEELAATGESVRRTRRLRESFGDAELIIGVDRLDYTKGLFDRLQAFQTFIERHEDERGRVVLLQIAPPSRTGILNYKHTRELTNALAGEINGRYGEPYWMPIRYLNRSFSRRTLAGLYRMSRIGLVTPLRDGMNLVAKEYVAAQRPEDPGVLILSCFAGAAAELEGALIVNPYDYDEVAEAIYRGLHMPIAERCERWTEMMAVLRDNSAAIWCTRFIDFLVSARAALRQPPPEQRAAVRAAS